MRWVLVTMLACGIALGSESAALAKKVPCKKIKEAIASGKTADQVATELGTRVQRVDACLAKKKNKAAAAGAASATGAADADEDAAEE
jgi:hypothetical protein